MNEDEALAVEIERLNSKIEALNLADPARPRRSLKDAARTTRFATVLDLERQLVRAGLRLRRKKPQQRR